MTKSYKGIALLGIWLLLLSPALPAQTPDSLLLDERVRELEKVLRLESVIENKVQAAQSKTLLTLLATSLGIVLAVLGGWVAVYQRTQQTIEGKIAEQMASLTVKRKEEILNLIAEQESEKRLREQARLLVMSFGQGIDRQRPLSLVLDQFSSRRVSYKILDQYLPVDWSQYDLILLDNEQGHFDEQMELVSRYLEESQQHQTGFFYLGSTRLDSEKMKAHLLASTANFPSQVYGNLLNLLRVQQLLAGWPK